jgi:hypothetical protein
MEKRETVCLSSRLRTGLMLSRQWRPRMALAMAIVVGAIFWTDAPCLAELVISAPNVSVAPGSSGSFDVLVTSTGGSFQVASDTVELSLNGLTGVSITGVSIATATEPYVYGANSATTQGSTFTFSTFPGTQFETFDFLVPAGAQTIDSGDSFGLVNVQYSVAADATGGSTGSLTFGPDTSLADASGNNVGFDSQSGSITISSVPEPSGLTLLAIGCAAIVACSARNRRARSIQGDKEQPESLA